MTVNNRVFLSNESAERRIVAISAYIVWLILLFVPFIPVANGQLNTNYGNTCENNPQGYTRNVVQATYHPVFVYYANGTYVPRSDCVKWTTYGSVVAAATQRLNYLGYE